MVTSIASQCCRILFLIGWAPLAHWKAENLASYYSHSCVCLHNLVYWMYLMEKPTGRHTGRQRHNGRITQTHLLKLNGRVPGTSLGLRFQRDLLYTAARLRKKGTGIQITQIFILDENVWQMTWAMAHATFWTFLMMHFTSPHVNVSMRSTGMEMRAETGSQGKW